jgi:hypothetical protein
MRVLHFAGASLVDAERPGGEMSSSPIVKTR